MNENNQPGVNPDLMNRHGNNGIHQDINPTPAPRHPTRLDPLEESQVETTEHYAAIHAAELNEFLAKREPAVSDAQLAANRANAQLSTGPTSQAGRAISARNNFRHGLTQTEGDLVLIETESADEYSQALADFQAEWQPVTATERDLVERLASRQWLRRRALKLQKYYISPGDGGVIDYDRFALYRRYEISHERAFNRAFADLVLLRNMHRHEKNGFESHLSKNDDKKSKNQSVANRHKLQELAIRTSEARATLQEHKLELALSRKKDENPPADV